MGHRQADDDNAHVHAESDEKSYLRRILGGFLITTPHSIKRDPERVPPLAKAYHRQKRWKFILHDMTQRGAGEQILLIHKKRVNEREW